VKEVAMSSVVTLPLPVKINQPRGPLMPVSVVGVFAEGVTPDQLLTGSAILEIRDAQGEALYWAEARLDGGRMVGATLQKFATGDRHYVHLDGPTAPSCTCEDATYRPDRPGGCRHVNALRMALVELAQRAGPAASPPA
jgi:hypothetical protein